MAANLNALPPISFDNIDVSVLFTSIEQNNTKVDALQLGLQMQNDTISKLQNTVDLLTGQIEHMCKITQRSTADVQTYAQGIQKEFNIVSLDPVVQKSAVYSMTENNENEIDFPSITSSADTANASKTWDLKKVRKIKEKLTNGGPWNKSSIIKNTAYGTGKLKRTVITGTGDFQAKLKSSNPIEICERICDWL